MEETPKKQYKINLFQIARVHTEQFVEEFETQAEAEAFAKSVCEDKGIDPDFEIEEVVNEAPAEAAPTTDVPAEEAPAETPTQQ